MTKRNPKLKLPPLTLRWLEDNHACDEARIWFSQRYKTRSVSVKSAAIAASEMARTDWVRWYFRRIDVPTWLERKQKTELRRAIKAIQKLFTKGAKLKNVAAMYELKHKIGAALAVATELAEEADNEDNPLVAYYERMCQKHADPTEAIKAMLA